MTIKEIEERSGMTRANIRFYESEELLSPERKANGYREYSEDDLKTLLRVRLLRSLGVPLDDIRALQTGGAALPDVLAQRLDALSSEQKSLELSREVCREMRHDGAQYATLDATRYLDALTREAPAAVPPSDAVPKVTAPWRRYFARVFDLALYGFAFDITLMLVFHVNYAGDSTGALRLLDLIAGVAGMLFLEPLLLSQLGTTPGKWLLGLAVTSPDGGRLSYRGAFRRSADVLVYGYGVHLPIYTLLRLYRSYADCVEGRTLWWEYDSVLTLRDEKGWRAIAYCAACAALSGAFLLARAAAELPRHRGELTVAEFCDNYNRIAAYQEADTLYRLDENGHWYDATPAGTIIIRMFDDVPMPELSFTEENGYVTGVSFEQSLTGNSFPPSYSTERQYLIVAFAGAQRGAGLYMGEARRAADHIVEAPYMDLDDTAYGVRIVSELDCAGYLGDGSDGWLFAEEGASAAYSIRFSMSKS